MVSKDVYLQDIIKRNGNFINSLTMVAELMAGLPDGLEEVFASQGNHVIAPDGVKGAMPEPLAKALNAGLLKLEYHEI